MQIISVVRDFEMYDRCVRKNPYNAGVVLHPIDNRTENKGIPTRYNEFLDAYDYSKPDWFVFCHEDWEIKEAWQSRLDELDKNNLYGPIGCELSNCGNVRVCGLISHSNKDGSDSMLFGSAVTTGKVVGTFDCQCLLVHSTLVLKYHLRFDENLLFNCYIEDFCIAAKEMVNVISCIFSINAQHFSRGNITERFYGELAYIRNKWNHANELYATCAQGFLIGRRWKFQQFLFKMLRFFYQDKRTATKHIIKIVKIPIYHKRMPCVK